MKLSIISILLAFVFVQGAIAQISSIASVRAAHASLPPNGTGSAVTVTGIVMNGSELGNIRYIQDGTGGIGVYGTSSMVTSLQRGDSIIVSGTVKNFNSLLEIDPVTSVTVVATNRPLYAPVNFNLPFTPAYAEAYEGILVRLNGATSITTTSGSSFTSFAGNTNYRINGDPNYILRVNSASTGPNGIVGKTPPSSNYDVIGIMSQFSPSSTSTGYQLLPRLIDDFVIPVPFITINPWASNITTTSFTVNFTTQNPGNTVVEYGLTPALGSSVSSSTLTTNHSINITGLTPATVYYVRASSTNSHGTSTSPIVPLITASNSSGTIKVYFNNSVNTTYAFPGNSATVLPSAIDDTIIAYINRAKYSIDIAIYNWGNVGISSISNAVNTAYANGKQVRVIYDGSTTSAGISALSSAIPKLASPTSSSYGIMHNKFIIIDANSADHNDPIVITGSTNWTDDQINNDKNALVIIQDKSLALAYKMEFEEMWGSNTTTPNPSASKFGPFKSNNTPHHFNIGGKLVELYFSPSDNVTSKLIETINSANEDFQAATMLCTRSDIANAIKNKHLSLLANGDSCSAVILNDTANASGPYFTMYSGLGKRLKIYNENSFIMHHKYLIVDASNPTNDPLVWVGSHNWTNSAETRNDENTLIIHDYWIANQFYQNFASIFNASTPTSRTACVYPYITSMSTSDNKPSPQNVEIYPNPTTGQITLNINNIKGEILQYGIWDVQGRNVILSEPIRYLGIYQVQLDISHLPQGIYLIRVQQGTQLSTYKILLSY
ncbi:MAG: phospholipase D-like domain-containing protein [Bacteroidia bacterium]|nr:phospholipase D-like domain-containing protein [Bacteroidia bacterium]MDW8301778.1 phospholipase D-like domain-containing protein [Bacteroidia bacterium]